MNKDNLKIINLTPHSINLILESNKTPETLTIEPESVPARVSQIRKQVGWLKDIPINKNEFGEVENLPEETDGVVYIVSMMVASALPKRRDLFIPDDVVRNEKGQIIGCRGLSSLYNEDEEV